MTTEELLFKICVMGSPSPSKTRLIKLFTSGKFPSDSLPFLGVDFSTKKVQVDHTSVNLFIVDSGDLKPDGRIKPSYYRGASAAIITFDKSSRSSFMTIKDWYNELKRHTSLQIKERSELSDLSKTFDMPLALIGFISESENVTSSEGKSLADELSMAFYELDSTNFSIIEQIFHSIIQKILENLE